MSLSTSHSKKTKLSDNDKKFYITTPIYYVNDIPHIGHAYTSIAADVIARFKTLDGYNVKFLTGTDEHGQKVEKSAKDKGIDPQSFTDKVSKSFKELGPKLMLTNTDFIRTTEPRHKKAATSLWERIANNGHIYKGEYKGWYSVRDEAFYQEGDLVDGKAPTGAPVEWVSEPSYFFNLSKWQDKLLKFYEDNPDFISPKSRRNEVVSFVKGGLKDLSVSRSTFSWGVSVPGDDKHIMYVWIDALTNYITSLGFPDNFNDNKAFWNNSLHLIGKDILRFHAVYWPAFLMAADLTPPKKVFAHGWWTNNGEKISKSLGNVIDPIALIDSYGIDKVRYFLMREVPFGADGDFSEKAFMSRTNSDLANDYGNLVQRVLSFIYKRCDGKLPECNESDFSAEDKKIINRSRNIINDMRIEIDNVSINKYIELLWSLVGDANRYIDSEEPWALRKKDIKRMNVVLYVLAEVIRAISIYAQPIVPIASSKALDILMVLPNERLFSHVLSCMLTPGSPINKPEILFTKIEEQPNSNVDNNNTNTASKDGNKKDDNDNNNDNNGEEVA